MSFRCAALPLPRPPWPSFGPPPCSGLCAALGSAQVAPVRRRTADFSHRGAPVELLQCAADSALAYSPVGRIAPTALIGGTARSKRRCGRLLHGGENAVLSLRGIGRVGVLLSNWLEFRRPMRWPRPAVRPPASRLEKRRGDRRLGMRRRRPGGTRRSSGQYRFAATDRGVLPRRPPSPLSIPIPTPPCGVGRAAWRGRRRAFARDLINERQRDPPQSFLERTRRIFAGSRDRDRGTDEPPAEPGWARWSGSARAAARLAVEIR